MLPQETELPPQEDQEGQDPCAAGSVHAALPQVRQDLRGGRGGGAPRVRLRVQGQAQALQQQAGLQEGDLQLPVPRPICCAVLLQV